MHICGIQYDFMQKIYQGSKICRILQSHIGENGVCLESIENIKKIENIENMEKMANIKQMTENTLFMIQNTLFMIQNTLFLTQNTLFNNNKMTWYTLSLGVYWVEKS